MHGVRFVHGAGGTPVAVHQLGRSTGSEEGRRDVVLVHAAGLHGQVWLPLVEHLGPGFRAVAPDVRGHGESGAPPEGGLPWADLAADLLAVVDGLGLHRPLGVGHSSGASLLLLAEERRPGTFAALYCIEPIGTAVDDPPPPDHAHPMSERARRRREVFASRQEAFEVFAGKPPLSDAAPEALRAYVEHGFVDAGEGGGVRLRCRPAHEAATYAHGLSHPAFRDLGRVACPVVLACGGRSATVTPQTLEVWKDRLPDATVEVLEGLGHLAPLEDPAGVAGAVVRAFTGGTA